MNYRLNKYSMSLFKIMRGNVCENILRKCIHKTTCLH